MSHQLEQMIIHLEEENSKLRSENSDLKKQMESWKDMHRGKWSQWAAQHPILQHNS
jgi:regulator of replication initiation timing